MEQPKNSAAAIKPSMEIFIPLKGLIDIDAEISRLSKELKKTDKDLAFIKKKLHNKEFMNKAPKAVVEENKHKYNEYMEKINAIQGNMEKLKELKKTENA